MSDQPEITPTADRAEDWLKAQAGKIVDPDSSTEEPLPDELAHEKTHEYRLKLEEVLRKLPAFIKALESTYKSTARDDDIYLPAVFFEINGYIYRYQRATVQDFVEDLSLERKKIEGEKLPKIPTNQTSKEYKDFWDEKIFIADFTDQKYSHTQYFNKYGDFQYAEDIRGQRSKNNLVNTPRVFAQIDRMCQELSTVSQK